LEEALHLVIKEHHLEIVKVVIGELGSWQSGGKSLCLPIGEVVENWGAGNQEAKAFACPLEKGLGHTHGPPFDQVRMKGLDHTSGDVGWSRQSVEMSLVDLEEVVAQRSGNSGVACTGLLVRMDNQASSLGEQRDHSVVALGKPLGGNPLQEDSAETMSS
jgi:hypothetical protein